MFWIVNQKNKAFTLIELVVVMAIITILLTLVLPAISTMWNQTHVQNAHQQISNLLRVARSRSETLQHIFYGVFFYVDPKYNHQVAVFIDGLPYPITPDEVWPDIIDRFRVDTTHEYFFPLQDFVRIAPIEALEWEDADLLNEDYRTGKQRNFFAIIFQGGERASPSPYILYDVDADDDGLGDTLRLPVGDIVGDFGGPVRDIAIDEDDERITIPTDWGFMIYDENIFKELRPNHLDLMSYLPYSLTRSGKTIALEKER